jgi:hypothetical protein
MFYLDLNALLVVISNPLVSFGGVRHLLLFDPTLLCSFKERANLASKQNERGMLWCNKNMKEGGATLRWSEATPHSRPRTLTPGCRRPPRPLRWLETPVLLLARSCETSAHRWRYRATACQWKLLGLSSTSWQSPAHTRTFNSRTKNVRDLSDRKASLVEDEWL